MTTAYLHPTITAALAKAEQKLDTNEWISCNPQQDALVAALPDLRALVADMPPGLQEAIGATDAKVINTWLAERGYSICLDPFAPGDFGVAAALDVIAKWRIPGSQIGGIRHKGQLYPAVMMKAGFTVYQGAGGRAVVQPDADVRVMLVVADDLEDGLAVLRGELTEATDVETVAFPMIDHDAQVDMSWLVGLRAGEARLSQVVAQAKLRVNEFGAHAKAAVAAAVTRSASMGKRVTIDQPFVIAFMHGTRPMIAFHVTPEAWKMPPNLGEKSDKRRGEVW